MKKSKLSQTAILFNAAALLVAGGSAAVVLRSLVLSDDIPSCKERFSSATRLSLDRDGTPVATEDLQARLGNTDWGLMEAGRVIKLKSGPSQQVLEIDLARAPSVGRGTSEHRAGVGFAWAPQSFRRPQSACLTYSVFLPDDFTFGRGGRLPGFAGGVEGDAEPAAGFSTRYTWTAKGEADIHAQLPERDGRPLASGGNAFMLERGRWTELEQEIVLNAPGKSNGLLRVWQDGKLVLQRKDLVFRHKPDVAISGVIAEAVAGEVQGDTKRGSQKIWLTPFELRWQ